MRRRAARFLRLLDMLATPVAAAMDPRGWAVDPGTYSHSSVRLSREWAPWQQLGIEPLPSLILEMPLLVQASWFGGTLRSSGPSATAWERFDQAARRFGGEATFVLFTDRPREALAGVRNLPDAPDLEPARSDWYLVRWAQGAGITLVSLFEFIAAFGGSPLLPFLQTELAKQTGPGYAAASDIARVVVSRAGGLYNDPDNTIESLNPLTEIGGTPEAFALAPMPNRRYSNSVIAVPRGHPIVDLLERKIMANYRLTQPELISVHGHRSTPVKTSLRKNSVLLRTGPGVVGDVLQEIGYSPYVYPVFAGIECHSAGSWLGQPDTGAPRRWTKRDTVEFTQKVIHSMVRSLYYRDGDLNLTRINDAVRTHADPGLIWQAALGFLSARKDLRPKLRSVTYSDARHPDADEARTWQLIRDLLPPAAAGLLQPAGEMSAEPDRDDWWLMILAERPVGARLTASGLSMTRPGPRIPGGASGPVLAAVQQAEAGTAAGSSGVPSAAEARTRAAGMVRDALDLPLTVDGSVLSAYAGLIGAVAQALRDQGEDAAQVLLDQAVALLQGKADAGPGGPAAPGAVLTLNSGQGAAAIMVAAAVAGLLGRKVRLAGGQGDPITVCPPGASSR